MRCTDCDRAATHVTHTGSPMCASHAPVTIDAQLAKHLRDLEGE